MSTPFVSSPPPPPPPGAGPVRKKRRHPARHSRSAALALSFITTSGLAYAFAATDSGASASIAEPAGVVGSSIAVAPAAATTTPIAPITTTPATAATTTPATTPSTTPTTTAMTPTVVNGASVGNRYGDVQVQATFAADGTLTNVDVIQAPFRDGQSVQINNYAVPRLNSEALIAQSAERPHGLGSDVHVDRLRAVAPVGHRRRPGERHHDHLMIGSVASVNSDREGTHHVEFVMGMAVSIDIRDPDTPSDAVADVVSWLHHVDATFSTYIDDSVISRLGRGELDIGAAPDEVRDVLRLCENMRIETNGAFDVFEVPAPNGTTLDPSGLVKGWSIERAAGMLEQAGCSNFCINAGGDIALRGRPSADEPWQIGIRHPDDAHALATVLTASGPLAVATSATYERGAHIIDPRTRQPTTDLASVTVVGPDLTVADAYATALFVMGLDGLDWIANHPGL